MNAFDVPSGVVKAGTENNEEAGGCSRSQWKLEWSSEPNGWGILSLS